MESAPPAQQGHATQMVRKVMVQVAAERRRNRSVLWTVILASVLVLAGAGGVVAWVLTRKQPEQAAAANPPADSAPTPAPPTTKELVKRMLNRKSVVFIYTRLAKGAAKGTGALIDKGKRQILTAHHVPEGGTKILVVFPRKKAGSDEFVDDPREYLKNDWCTPARVIRTNPELDLALLEVDEVPADAEPLPLAKADPEAGDTAHTVGNSTADVGGGMWAPTSKMVRAVRKDTTVVGGQRISARVLKTDIPVNPGDSGGPVVNDRGELIGVNSWINTEHNTESTHIAVSEVHGFLK